MTRTELDRRMDSVERAWQATKKGTPAYEALRAEWHALNAEWEAPLRATTRGGGDRPARISKARAIALHRFVKPAAKALRTNNYTLATRACGRGIGTYLDLTDAEADALIGFVLPFHAEG